MESPYLVDELVIRGGRVLVVPHRRFRSKYLREDFFVDYEAGVSLEELDHSILVIPFLLNVLPLIWIAGDTYRIRSLDAELAFALEDVRKAFQRLYPDSSWDGEVIPDATVVHTPAPGSQDVALLFSGGVDSTYSSLVHRKTPQRLITIASALGLGIERDQEAYASAKTHFRGFSAAFGQRSSFVTSNLCGFISPAKLVRIWPRPRRWLIEVQHGLGFVGVSAPLMQSMRIRRLLMAGCERDHYGFHSGSHPDIVGSIRWSGVEVSQDGHDKTRQQKLHTIRVLVSDLGRRPPVLKPCLQPVGGFENCCVCDKCLQTIMGILAEGDDPKAYGFETEPQHVLSILRDKFSTCRVYLPDMGELMQWHGIQSAIRALVREPGPLPLLLAGDSADLLWFARLDLVRYCARYWGGLRGALRKTRRRLGLLLDVWPAFGRVARLLLRPFL